MLVIDDLHLDPIADTATNGCSIFHLLADLVLVDLCQHVHIGHSLRHLVCCAHVVKRSYFKEN